MIHRICLLTSLAVVALGCGDQECPAGTMPEGEACVPIADAGTDDGSTTPDSCTPTTFYRDGDGDGFGDAADSMLACGPPPMGYADVPPGDCDDGAATINPNASETCDDVDQDCDGAVDEGRLGLVASPISIGEHGRMRASPNLDRFSGGYVTLWKQETRATWLLLDAAGAPTSSQSAIDMASEGAGQNEPSMAVVRAMSGVERAVVAWATDDGTIRARALRLDGLTSPASVIVSVGDGTALQTTLRVVEWNQLALLLWVPVVVGVDGPLRAQLLDPETAMPIGSAVTVLERAAGLLVNSPAGPLLSSPAASTLSDGGALVAVPNAATGRYFVARLAVEGTTLTVAETAEIVPPRPVGASQVLPLANARSQGVLFTEDDLVGVGYVAVDLDPLMATSDWRSVGAGLDHIFIGHDRSMTLGFSTDGVMGTLPLEITQVVRTMGVDELVRTYLFDMDIADHFGADIDVEDEAHVAILLATVIKGGPDVRFAKLGCR